MQSKRLADTEQGLRLAAAHTAVRETGARLDEAIRFAEETGPRRVIQRIELEDTTPRVLLADDEIPLLSIVERRIQAAGFHVAPASSLAQAAQLVAAGHITCAVIDWRWPTEGAPLTLLSLCRQREIPRCIMTGWPDDITDSVGSGVPVFTKGDADTFERLVKWIERVTARSQAVP